MALEYVKHSREVSVVDQQKFGKFATHDIHVPVLLLYELGTTKDKNGNSVNINLEFLEATQKATNNWIKKRYNSPFAKLKSFWSKSSIDEVEAISIIKNHDLENVDNTVGHLRGLIRLENIDGVMALIGTAVIKDIEAKQKISGDLLRNTSVGIRSDGSIRELSFVINEAAPHGGLLMSEDSGKNIVHNKSDQPLETNNSQSPEKELMLAEFAELQNGAKELDDIIIPNHIILTRLIKTGKIAPWKYDELITTRNKEALEFMESSLPSVDLGVMYGTKREPQETDPSDIIIDSITKKYSKKPGRKPKDKTNAQELNPKHLSIINQVHSFEDQRTKELNHILELAEHSPQVLLKYLRLELGKPQSVEDCASKDIQLAEYISRSKEIKNKIEQLTIELGEHNGN